MTDRESEDDRRIEEIFARANRRKSRRNLVYAASLIIVIAALGVGREILLAQSISEHEAYLIVASAQQAEWASGQREGAVLADLKRRFGVNDASQIKQGQWRDVITWLHETAARGTRRESVAAGPLESEPRAREGR